MMYSTLIPVSIQFVISPDYQAVSPYSSSVTWS